MSAERLSVKPLARATAGQKELGETGARRDHHHLTAGKMSAERLSVKPLARATAGQKELGLTTTT